MSLHGPIDPREVTLPVTVDKIENGWIAVDASKRMWSFPDSWNIHYYLINPVNELIEGTWKDPALEEEESNDAD